MCLQEKIRAGNRLVLAQGSTLLKATAVSNSKLSSTLRITSIKVLAGALPPGIRELTVDYNLWDVYLESDLAAPQSSEHKVYAQLIEALSILSTYSSDQWLAAKHGELRGGPDPSAVTPEHLARLEALGWHADSDAGSFYHFV